MNTKYFESGFDYSKDLNARYVYFAFKRFLNNPSLIIMWGKSRFGWFRFQSTIGSTYFVKTIWLGPLSFHFSIAPNLDLGDFKTP